jgi:putative colanic acid biosynthesis glycosyltransferase
MLISIVTINLNNAEGLEKTINSVRQQTRKDYEFIIIDGNSVDNSQRTAQNNKDIINFFISEPDKGIYDAMNKGLNQAHGDFVVFLNSGDTFYDETILDYVINNITLLDKVYFGSTKIFYDEHNFYLYPQPNGDVNYIIKFLKYYKPCHQAVFFPRIFYSQNNYDIQYTIFSDLDYKIGAMKRYGYIFLNKVVVDFLQGGFSSVNSFEKVKKMNREYIDIYKKNGVYSIRMHFRFFISLVFKYFLFLLFRNRSVLFVTKTRALFK